MHNTMWVTASALVFCLCIGASPVQAQGALGENAGFLGVNIGLQQTRSFTEIARPDIYAEPATITVEHEVGALPLIDFLVGVRLRNSLGLAVGFTRLGDSDSPEISAQVPHPIGTDQHRTATATTDDLSHSETAVHVQLAWMMPVTEDFEITALAGPAFYAISQDVVTNLRLSEGPAPAFSRVDITAVETANESKRAVGFTVGLDGTYVVTPRFGAGGFVRFSRASADLPVAGGGTMDVTAGGFQLGVGLRARF